MEYFTSPHLSKPVNFNKDDILDDERRGVIGVVPYMLEAGLIIIGIDGDREPQGDHR